MKILVNVRFHLLFRDFQSQLFELLLLYCSRSSCHQAGCVFHLREGDNFTDTVLPCHQHNQPVQTVCQSCMGRNAIFKCAQQEAKLVFCSFLRKSQHFKHLGLNIILVDSHASAADFIAVQGDIVSLCADSARIRINFIQIFFHRHGKRMMHRHIPVLFLRVFQQWEFRNPQEFIFILFQQPQALRDFQAKRPQHVPHNFIFVSCKEK